MVGACNRIKLKSSSDRSMCEYPLLSQSISRTLSVCSLHIVSIGKHTDTEEDHDDRDDDHHLYESESSTGFFYF